MPDDASTLFAAAAAAFSAHAHAVSAKQWDDPTPCTEWSVRDLVNHITGEELWAVELFAGRTIAEVGAATFDGDQLGDEPVARLDGALEGASRAMSGPTAMTDTVHLSFGDLPGSEYAMQLFADLVVHGWDLAMALARDPDLDPNLVTACGEWFSSNEEAYRSAGAIGPRPELPADADDLTQLIVAFGRSPDWRPPAG